MNGFQAEIISPADCISQVLAGLPFPAVSMHVLFSTYVTTMPTNFQSGFCGNVAIPSHSTAGLNAVQYGKTDHQPAGFDFDTSLWFDLSEVSTWGPVTAGTLPYTQTYHGPRFKSPSTYIRLRKRNQATAPFQNLTGVNWTDATDQTWGQDWLGNLMPGGWCYVNRNVSEPMNGESFWEDARKTTDPINPVDRTSAMTIHQNWMPFCNALNVYDNVGGLLGTFDGIAWMIFWNVAGVKNPLNPPDDAVYIGSPPIPKLDPSKQIMSLEVWFYLTSTAPTAFKSPRVAAQRYWTYTRTHGSGNSPFDPYLFFGATVGFNAQFIVPINFQLLDNGNNPTHLAAYQANLVFSNLKFMIGA